VSIRVFEQGWQDQYERMRRSTSRTSEAFINSDDYDDAFYHAVQDAWHLKDWINGDDKLPLPLRSKIVTDADSDRTLGIVADVANCTKHLVLTRNIHQGAALHSASSEVNLGNRSMKREIVVRLKDGSTHSGADLLKQALSVWDTLLRTHGLL